MSAHRFVARCAAPVATATMASLGFSTATQAAAFHTPRTNSVYVTNVDSGTDSVIG